MIKKLFILAVIAVIAYGVWWYMQQVQQKTAEHQGVLKKSEKFEKELDKEQSK